MNLEKSSRKDLIWFYYNIVAIIIRSHYKKKRFLSIIRFIDLIKNNLKPLGNTLIRTLRSNIFNL